MYHTRAIILKKEDWNEADWLVTVLSSDFGKIRLLAQGARKHGAKLQGHLEPGSIADISLVIGRNGYRMTSARMREFFPAAHRSLAKLRAIYATLSILDANLLEERDGAEEIFKLGEDTLRAMDRCENLGMLRRIIVWFHARLLEFLGLLPAAGSREGDNIKLLLNFVSRPLADIEGLEVGEDLLERELVELIRELGGQSRQEAVVFSDLAI
mgnify:FL=1